MSDEDEEQETPAQQLLQAVRRRQPEDVFRTILESNSDIPTNEMWNVIWHAFGLHNDAAVLRMLIEHDQDVTLLRSLEGHFLLHYACVHNAEPEILELLINSNNDEASTCDILNDAARELAREGALVMQVLHCAVEKYRTVKQFRLLLQFVHVIATEEMASLVFHAFERFDDSAVLRLLIQKDPGVAQVQLTEEGDEGCMLLHHACRTMVPYPRVPHMGIFHYILRCFTARCQTTQFYRCYVIIPKVRVFETMRIFFLSSVYIKGLFCCFCEALGVVSGECLDGE